MSSVVKTGVVAHDNACLSALNTLMAGLQTATTQAAVNALYVTFHRAIVASGKTNNGGNGIGPSLDALRSFGLNA